MRTMQVVTPGFKEALYRIAGSSGLAKVPD